jgi:hypothetical protein
LKKQLLLTFVYAREETAMALIAEPGGSPPTGDFCLVINDSVYTMLKKRGLGDDIWMKTLAVQAKKCSLIPAQNTPNFYICHAALIPLDPMKPIQIIEFPWDPQKKRYRKISEILQLNTNNIDLYHGKPHFDQSNLCPYNVVELKYKSICEMAIAPGTYRYLKSRVNKLSEFNHRAHSISAYLGVDSEGHTVDMIEEAVGGTGCFGCFGKKKTKIVGVSGTAGVRSFDCGTQPTFTADCLMFINGGVGNSLINAVMKTDRTCLPKPPPNPLVPPSMPLGVRAQDNKGVLLQDLGGETSVRRALTDIFGQYDNDGDGHIDTEELYSMMVDLHIVADEGKMGTTLAAEDVVESKAVNPGTEINGLESPDQEVAASVMKSLDANRNGTLECTEFETWMIKGIQQSTQQLDKFKTLGPKYKQLHNFLICVVQQIRIKVGATEDDVDGANNEMKKFQAVGGPEDAKDPGSDDKAGEEQRTVKVREYSGY